MVRQCAPTLAGIKPGCIFSHSPPEVSRQKHLERILSDGAHQRFLAEAGYEDTNLDGLLAQLAYRLETRPEFPHESGLKGPAQLTGPFLREDISIHRQQ